MKRLMTAILIVGAFLGGYYLGRQKDSPDILAWARDSYPHLAESAGRLMSNLASRCESAVESESEQSEQSEQSERQSGRQYQDGSQQPADRNAPQARRHGDRGGQGGQGAQGKKVWYAADGTAYAYPSRHEPISP